MTAGLCNFCMAQEGSPHAANCPKGAYEAVAKKDRPLQVPPQVLAIAIPPEVEQYAPEIRRFVEAMVYKLGVHASKGKWENQTIESRVPKLEDEVKELVEAIKRGNMVEILLESADVANYALIISAKAME